MHPAGPSFPLAIRAAALYCACTVLLAWPLVFNASSSAMPGDPDTDLFVWTLAWNTHALTSAPWAIFDANVYYPERLSLAFSENLIASSLVAAPVLWLTGDHVLAFNVTALLTIPLSGLGAFLLGRRVGLTVPAALLCGMFFAFSPARFFRLGQLHLTAIQWMPFCLAYLHAYLDGGRRHHLYLALGFFTLQALASGHGVVFLAVAILALLAYSVARGMPLAPVQRLRDFGLPGLLLVTPALLVYLPYTVVQRQTGLRRSLVNWETTPHSFLASVAPLHQRAFTWFTDVDFNAAATAYLLPGFALLALAAAAGVAFVLARASRDGWLRVVAGGVTAIALAALALATYVSIFGPVRLRTDGAMVFTARDPWRPLLLAVASIVARAALLRHVPLKYWSVLPRSEAASRERITFYALLALVSVLLAAGPPVSLWPLVYDLPGFNFIRVPSRFMLLGLLALAVVGGRGFDVLVAGFRSRTRRVLAALVGLIVLAECYTVPLPGHRPYSVDIPAADRWLATEPGPVVVAEVPANHHSERLHSTYMLHSMAHWHPTVHGHSGIRTPLHVALYSQLQRFPSEVTLRRLADAGVTHVVVHPALYGADEWARVEREIEASTGLGLVFREGEDRVYRLTAPRSF